MARGPWGCPHPLPGSHSLQSPAGGDSANILKAPLTTFPLSLLEGDPASVPGSELQPPSPALHALGGSPAISCPLPRLQVGHEPRSCSQAILVRVSTPCPGTCLARQRNCSRGDSGPMSDALMVSLVLLRGKHLSEGRFDVPALKNNALDFGCVSGWG